MTTTSPAQTRQVGGVLGRALRQGDVIALTGEIGAGKTCLVQGAAVALGVTTRVTSPSFILRKEYQGRTYRMLHLDVYRLESMQEALDFGFADADLPDTVTFVEWGDAMAPLLPTDHLEIEMRLPPLEGPSLERAAAAGDWQPEPRTIVLKAHGHDWARRLEDIGPRLSSFRKVA